MTFEELGQTLKAGREAKGLSLEAVAEKIKVSARILRHIEEGHRNALPHAVYTRGFILSYAEVIDIPQEKLLPALNDHLTSPDETSFVNSPLPVYSRSANMYSRIAGFLVVILVLAGLLGGGWFVYDRHGKVILEYIKLPFSAITSPEPASEASVPETGPVAGLGGGSGFFLEGNANATRVDPPAPVHTENTVAEAPSTGTLTPAEMLAENTAAHNASTPADTGRADAARAAEGNQVYIQATARCWVRSQADGAPGREFTMKPGESTVLPYKNKLRLSLGNPAGVKILDNGKEYKGKLEINKPATIEFPAL